MTSHDRRYSMEIGIPCRGIESSGTNQEDRIIAVQSEASVLITWEDPDERSDCARSIHMDGSRRTGPFVEFDCRLSSVVREGQPLTIGMDDDLAAHVRHQFREASGGTLFLNYIERMTDGVQEYLMSLLDEADLHRDAAVPRRRSAARIIAGASGSLLAAVSAGTFNEALFYRLNVIHLDFTNGYR